MTKNYLCFVDVYGIQYALMYKTDLIDMYGIQNFFRHSILHFFCFVMVHTNDYEQMLQVWTKVICSHLWIWTKYKLADDLMSRFVHIYENEQKYSVHIYEYEQ